MCCDSLHKRLTPAARLLAVSIQLQQLVAKIVSYFTCTFYRCSTKVRACIWAGCAGEGKHLGLPQILSCPGFALCHPLGRSDPWIELLTVSEIIQQTKNQITSFHILSYFLHPKNFCISGVFQYIRQPNKHAPTTFLQLIPIANEERPRYRPCSSCGMLLVPPP